MATKGRTARTPWHVAFQRVEPYVVKITTPQTSGTGFLVASTGSQELLGIATAAHVIDFPHYWEQPIRIQHFQSGKTVFLNHPDRSIDIDYNRDTASIVTRGGELPFPKDTLQIISEDMHLKVGVEVGWMGFPAIAPSNLCFFSGNTSCWLEEERFYFVDGVAINGVSGGPTFRKMRFKLLVWFQHTFPTARLVPSFQGSAWCVMYFPFTRRSKTLEASRKLRNRKSHRRDRHHRQQRPPLVSKPDLSEKHFFPGPPLLHLLPHLPGDGDYGVSREWGYDREGPGHCRARIPPDYEALRPHRG